MAGIYLHIPYCSKKCIYCDFYSIGVNNAPWTEFANAVINEFAMRFAEITEPVTTIYIGGGTPSLMPTKLLSYIIKYIKDKLVHLWQVEEFTIEVNPDDVTTELIDALVEIGINRISMGVQSFNDDELKIIGRRHSVEQIFKAYNDLSAITNKSLDLIFGLPTQTLESWNKNLDNILKLRPNHISAYCLMIEDNTPIKYMLEYGKIDIVDDETIGIMFKMLISRLKSAGYMHYEISNFALPGYTSKHNSSYWNGCQYLGLGPAAHSYDGKFTRASNPSNVNKYIDYYLNNGSNDISSYQEIEHLTDVERYNEYIMTRLRTADGIVINELSRLFSMDYITHFNKQSKGYIESGMLSINNGKLSLTEQGILISDSIMVALIK